MKIGIVGVGHIGKTLALQLAKAGHDVSVANSKTPENMDPEVRLRAPGRLLLSKRCRIKR